MGNSGLPRVAGNITFNIIARGKLGRTKWQRQIIQAIQIPQAWETGHLFFGNSLGKVSRLRIADGGDA